jgi:hypothetical protein
MLQVAANALPANAPGMAAANQSTVTPAAYGATNAAPTVPVQTPAAVAATGAVAAYAPQTPKPPARLTAINQPSSALAAQYLAQTPNVTTADLQLFAPLVNTTPTTVDAESLAYLKDLRVANGEVAAAVNDEAAAPQNTNTATAASASARPSSAAAPQIALSTSAALTAAAASNPATNAIAGAATAPAQARPSPAPLVPQGKKPGIGEARGSDAYQVAQARNFFTSFPASVTAVF